MGTVYRDTGLRGRGRLCNGFALSQDACDAFLNAYKQGDDAVMQLLEPLLSNPHKGELHLEMDKA